VGHPAFHQERFGKFAFAADFESAEVFVPRPVGGVRFGFTPELELVEIFCGYFALFETVKEMLAESWRMCLPAQTGNIPFVFNSTSNVSPHYIGTAKLRTWRKNPCSSIS
jgi:hypothetical protein